MTLPANTDRLPPLLAAMLDQRLTDQQAAELQQLVRDDPASRREYVRQIVTHSMLQWAIASPEGEPGVKSRNEAEKNTPGDGRSNQVAPPLVALDAMTGASHFPAGYFTSGWAIAYLIATVIFAIGLAISAVVHVSGPTQIVSPSFPSTSPVPSHDSIVARITGMVDCVWEGGQQSAISGQQLQSTGHYPLATNHSVTLGDTIALRSGLLEITYDTGARVILQGPVTYEVESPAGGYLSLGKLTASLEKGSGIFPNPKRQRGTADANPKRQRGTGGTDDSNGSANPLTSDLCPLTSDFFSVRTPTALVTDLGTEFGVEVSKQGNTTSRVFRGSVRVQPLEFHTRAAGEGRVLHENESIRVDGQSGDQGVPRVILGDASAASVDFVREITKPSIKTFDLVDVVAGGDGFSGRRGGGIDPLSGRIVDALDTAAKSPWSGDGKYHRVTGRPFVDGVFVPNGGKGAVQVDSAGHTFDGFLPTANLAWQYVWAGGALSSENDGEGVPTKLGDVDYASPGHGLIYLNGNSAITFDLEAIRRANPDCRLLRFRAVAGNVGSMGVADIRVLVDGRQWFQRWQINGQSGAFVVVVPIADRDRFLTLATTDGGDGISGDWLIFGDPCLEVTIVETPARAPAAQTAILH